MAIFQIQSKDSVYRINDTDAVSCIQSFNWDAQMNAEQLSQIGSPNYDGQIVSPEVSATFEMRSTGSTAALLNRMIYSFNPSTGEYVPPASTAATLNNALIRETDLERAICDLIECKQANETFDRSTLIPHAFLKSIQLSAKSDGTATETYAFDADLLEIYRKPFHDLRSVPLTRDTAGTPADTAIVPVAYTVESNSVIAGATHKIVLLDVDGTRIPASMFDVTSGTSGNPDKLVINATGLAAGHSFPLGARIHAIMYAKTPGAFPTIVPPVPAAINSNYSTTARFVKADHINIYLVDPASLFTVGSFTNKTVAQILDNASPGDLNQITFSDNDLFLRVQSCDISLDLQRDKLTEIRKNDRGNSVYYRSAKFPMAVTAAISAYETDLNDWAKIQGKNAMGAATPDILNLADFEVPQWMIVMRYYKQDTVLQTVVLADARVTGPGHRMQVSGRSEVSWNFTGSKLYIKGSAV